MTGGDLMVTGPYAIEESTEPEPEQTTTLKIAAAPITKEFIATSYPGIAEDFRQEGIEGGIIQERNRIKEIFSLKVPKGYEQIREKLAFTPGMTEEKAALEIMNLIGNRGLTLEQLESAAQGSNRVVAVPVSGHAWNNELEAVIQSVASSPHFIGNKNKAAYEKALKEVQALFSH